jgi:hypothetical protein
MKKLKIILSIIMITVLFFNCIDDNNSGGLQEITNIDKKPETDTTSLILKNVSAGPYTLNLVLLKDPPWNYKIQIKDFSTDEIVAETRADLGARPLPYYADEDYLVLMAASEEGETDGLGDPAILTFLVFDISSKSFRRYGVTNPEIMSFRIIEDILYAGNHLMESPCGAVTVIDLDTGETTCVYQVKDGDELRPIETWAPMIGLNTEGDVVVQITEDDGRLYKIENDYLVFAEEGSIEEFENPDLPVR